MAGLLLRTRENRVANRLLAALLLVVVLRLVPYIIGYAGFYDAYPWLSFAPFDNPLAIGPLLWLYVARLTRGVLPPRWGWHLLPAAVHFVTWFVLFAFVPLDTRHALVRAVIDPWVAPAITLASLAGLAAYGVRALAERRAYQQWLDDHLSNREEYTLTWLQWLLRIMAAVGLAWLGRTMVELFVRPLSYFDEFPFYLLQAAAVWVLGLLAWRDAERRYPTPAVALPVGNGDGARSPHSAAAFGGLADAASSEARVDSGAESGADARAESRSDVERDWAHEGAQVLQALRSREWWRDPQLTLPLLARHLHSNSSTLSRVLNRGLGQNFNECVNRLRVEAVSRELEQGSTRDLVQIGFDCGFNSKASFQRAFVRYAGTTPSAYRDAVRAGAGLVRRDITSQ